MSAGHLHSSHPINAEHERLLAQLLDDPQFSKAVSAYTKRDNDHQIPFLAGSNNAGDTIYWDRDFYAAVKAGKVKYDGKPYDPTPFTDVHEAVEGAAIRTKGANYDTDNAQGLPGGHILATVAERHAVEHAGLNWQKYQDSLKPFIRADEKEKVTDPPPDLLKVPYDGTPQAAEVGDTDGEKPAQQSAPSVGEPITRDAFLYLEPRKAGDLFAQCQSCVFRVGGELRCGIMGGKPVEAEGTCAAYIEGDGVEKPIADETPDEVGYTVRQVRCENCAFGGAPDCALYADLNAKYPQLFRLDTKIKPDGCCNANTPKGEDAMADLTSGRRNALPASQFGLPGSRKYPMPDKAHAANAKARATQQVKAGNLSPSSKAQIDAKANRILGRSPGGYVPNPVQMGARGHALSIASATHLHNAGHLPAAQTAAIHAKARAGLNALKKGPAAPMPFGSLAPALPPEQQ